MDPGEQVSDSPEGWVARHIRRYVDSDGAKGHEWRPGVFTLLLTTRGRRTGKLRRTALYYGRDGDRYVLVATPTDGREPAWYLNLRASPAVVLQVRSQTLPAVASPASASDRPRLWRLMLDVFPRYATYEREAGRELAVVVVRASSGPHA
jgi:deazaflavin-dependent oxidoreductase (nitroreductase family)